MTPFQAAHWRAGTAARSGSGRPGASAVMFPAARLFLVLVVSRWSLAASFAAEAPAAAEGPFTDRAALLTAVRL